MPRIILSAVVFTLAFSMTGLAQTLEQAQRLYTHNLTDDAKRALIAILYSDQAADVKAEASYRLGQIAFETGAYPAALTEWSELVRAHPESPQARQVVEQLAQLREVITQTAEATLSNSVARSYVRNGDFWSHAERRFSIDGSRLPHVELAVEWYDRTIREFPGGDAAELAYERKLSTLLGWEESGRDGSSYGLRADFDKFIPTVLGTFESFERDFPRASSLQAYRYQIAQAFWRNKYWHPTRTWLQKVLDAAGNDETFYAQAARARLAKVEY